MATWLWQCRWFYCNYIRIASLSRFNVRTFVKAERDVPSIKVRLVLFYFTKSYHIVICFYICFYIRYDFFVHFSFIFSNCLFILFSFPFPFHSFSFLLFVPFSPFFFFSSLSSSSPILSPQTMCFAITLWFSKLLLQRNSSYFGTFWGSLGFPFHSYSEKAWIKALRALGASGWWKHKKEEVLVFDPHLLMLTSAEMTRSYLVFFPVASQLVSILSIDNIQPLPCSTLWSGKLGSAIEVCLEISLQLHHTLLFLGHAWGTLRFARFQGFR